MLTNGKGFNLAVANFFVSVLAHPMVSVNLGLAVVMGSAFKNGHEPLARHDYGGMGQSGQSFCIG